MPQNHVSLTNKKRRVPHEIITGNANAHILV